MPDDEFKLTIKVAEKLGIAFTTFSNNEIRLNENWEIFRPCQNIAQAWPIMMENDISIQIEPGAKPAAIKGMRHTGSGEYFDTFTFELMGCNDNPLVAAMAVLVGEEY